MRLIVIAVFTLVAAIAVVSAKPQLAAAQEVDVEVAVNLHSGGQGRGPCCRQGRNRCRCPPEVSTTGVYYTSTTTGGSTTTTGSTTTAAPPTASSTAGTTTFSSDRGSTVRGAG